MFKYVIVVLALIAAALAGPRPQFIYPSAEYAAYSSNYVQPAATVYSTGYVPTAYSAQSSYIAPATYNAAAAYPYAYL